MGGKRTSITTFAVLFASFLLFVSGAVPVTRDVPRHPAGVLEGFQARTRLPTIAFSPDGTRLGVLGHGAVVTLWDVLSGQQGVVLDNKGADITAFAFDPSGRSVAGVGADDRITLWDLTTGMDRLTLFPGSLGTNVRAIGFSPDGTALASLGDDNSVIVWDPATGIATRMLSAHSDTINSLAFSPDGKVLASGSRDSTVALWDVSAGEEPLIIRNPSHKPIDRVAFSTDGGTVAGVGQDGQIMLWSSATGTLKRTLASHAAAVTEAAFGPDGQNLVSVGADARITLWDPVTGRRRLTLANHTGVTVNDVAFSPDGKTLATATDDTGIALWDVDTGRLRRTLFGHDDSVASVTFSPDGRALASVGKNGQFIVWDLVRGTKRFTRHMGALGADAFAEAVNGANNLNAAAPSGSPANGSAPGIDSKTPNQLRDVQGLPLANITSTGTRKKPRRHDWKGITALAVSPDGALVGTAGEDSAIRLWNATGLERFALAAHHDAGVTGIAFSADGTRLVSVGRDTEVRLSDVTTGTQNKVLLGHEHPIRAIAASPDGKTLASAGEDTRIMLWDAVTGKLTRILSGHTDFINSLAFSGDGKRLASGDAAARVLLWDVAAGTLVKTFLGHSGEVNAVAFSRDGSVLVSAGEDTQVKVWNAATGEQIRSLLGHQAPVRAVAISPNGQTVVSAGEDARILVWDVASGQLRRVLPKHNRFINALAFDPTGRLFVGDEDQDLTEWDVSVGKKLRVRRAAKRLQQDKSSSAAPSATSRTLGLLIPSDSERSAYSDTNRNANLSLQEVFGAVLEWLVPAAAAQLPDPNQGPGGPILVVTGPSATFGRYYAEILRNEGLNLFAVSDISSVNAGTLANYDAVILAPVPLSVAQVGMFTDWVNAGGNLVAMRPDPQLSGLLGISAAGATLSNAYLLVDTSQPPGNGIVGQTIQFHGTADRYTLNGASSLATLYANAITATSNPAVTLRSVGANGGQAAAFTYDLATSIVYTRQGNPAWAAQERDGFTPIRSDDKFFGDATGNPQPDWVDLSKVAIPQADEQQRLLANLILEINRDKKPLPRFWYFPRRESALLKKAVVIMTGDDHANGGTAGRFDWFKAQSPAGCSVANWECVRGTSYIYAGTTLSNAQAAAYHADGFEVGLHINTNCADYTPASLETFYTQQIAEWTATYPSIPPPSTQRHHCIPWSDWLTGAKVQFNHAIRLDTTYYFWPPGWVLNRPGFFTGSGMPMRFADLDGSFIDVYHAASQMTDESGQQYPFTIDSLLDGALGAEGYYGAFTINAHTDVARTKESDDTVSSALSRGVPIVSSQQMMTWLDGRNSSSFGSLAWSGSALSFTVTPGTGANGLQGLVPMASNTGVLATLTRDGGPVGFTTDTIKGVGYAFFPAIAGTYVATYAADTGPPTVTSTSPANGATGVSQGTNVTATFSEAMGPTTVSTATFELRGPGSTVVSATVTYDAPTKTATLKPTAPLAATTTYAATVKGGATDPRAKDLAGNALAANFTWSFTTAGGPSCPCSGWGPSTTPGTAATPDPSSVELGVKFTSDFGGVITGVRFYKGSPNTGTHTGTLWTNAGQQLAIATFTNETGTGWQQVNFANPVAITANTVYVASYHAPNGNYAFDPGYFANSGVDNGPLHFLKDGVSGGNGVYAYSASTTFPASTYQSSNYWVDVVFTTSVGPDTTPPAVATMTPANGVTGVSSGATVNATFSEAIDPATISGSTFELRDASAAPVTATVSYSTATNTATLTPISALANSVTYTATVRGGTTDPRVKDIAGNALAANFTWSFTTAAPGGSCASPANPVVAENCMTGNPASEWDISGAGDASIQGFATDISVNRGSTVSFKIKTTATNYRLDIYRMGYYGGQGARKVATVLPSATLPQTQPACQTDTGTKLVDCGNWAVSASWAVPSNATSGIYFATLVRPDTGGASHIIFIVRDDASHSDLLFQTSDQTWQAYNNFSASLYGPAAPGEFDQNNRAYKVSYNRPFHTREMENGISWVFNAEYPMVRWLEANGNDVSYFTGVDAARFGSLILNHKVFMSVGHDEYWSGQQRTNVENARNAGRHLAFFSGNTMFWKTRWENSIDGSNTAYRTLVCYKETHANAAIDPQDPPIWTGTWRDPRFSPPADGGRPENALIGTAFMVNGPRVPPDALQVPAADGKMRFWRNTSIATLLSGQTATLPAGTLGYEWDLDLDNGSRPSGLVRMSTTSVNINGDYLLDHGSTYGAGTAVHHLTLYRHPGGALVFGGGTVQWSWGLDANHDAGFYAAPPVDPRLQQATVNLFADMGVQPATLQGGLIPATASTDTVAPTSTITSPATGSNVPVGSAVTISGTASDSGGGVVGGVEVSVDNGATWHPTNGRASWTYTWTPTTSGTAVIKSRAVDDSGSLETPSSGVTVTVGSGSDTTSPTVSMTAPNDGATVSGTAVTVSANAADNVGVASVQFLLDGAALGSPDTAAPYSILWNSTTATNGSHILSAQARDAANNTATATNVTVTVSNGGGGTPVTLVGDTTIRSNVDNNPAGIAEAFQYTAVGTGTANKLYLYVDGSNAATQVVVGLYSDNANDTPGSLLAQATISNPTGGAWNVATLSSASINAGTKYWIAVLGPSGAGLVKFRDVAGGGGKAQVSAQSNLTSLPATWSSGTNFTDGPMSAYAVHEGPPPTLTSIAVTPANPTIQAGVTQQFTATGTYSDGSTQNITSQVAWASSSTAVATISTAGLATGVGVGSTSISAALNGVTGSTTLTVQAAATLTSIAVTPANPTIQAGATQQFTATGTYSGGSTQNITSQVTWASSSTAAATINAAGLATGVGAGSTSISATLNGVTGSTTLTVQAAATPPSAVNDLFLFLANNLRTVNYTGPLGAGVLANDTDPANQPLTAVAVGTIPTGVTLASNGVVTINRSTAINFRYRANNGSQLSQPTTGALVTLALDTAPRAVLENCTYTRAGTGSVTGVACAMTGTRTFTMNLKSNDTDADTTTNVPVDGVGKTVVRAIITATGTGVAVSANNACGQAAITKLLPRATITNNCDGTLGVAVSATAPASPITFTYGAVDDLGAPSTTANRATDTVTVQ